MVKNNKNFETEKPDLMNPVYLSNTTARMD
jgi:hypothetical protein